MRKDDVSGGGGASRSGIYLVRECGRREAGVGRWEVSAHGHHVEADHQALGERRCGQSQGVDRESRDEVSDFQLHEGESQLGGDHPVAGWGSLVVLLLAERARSEGARSTRAFEDRPGYP